MDNKNRYSVVRNKLWWAVWDNKKDEFALYLGKSLSRCGIQEAHRLADLLNTMISPQN
jgi:hypothetical protein